ncbi:hypothetical protein, partial [Methanosarcina spelaei]|uniref:hypothetical protein n=1 Tax=Methanosarcina spelaei TaxID=1036679 RepID=UPI001BAFF666
MLDKNNIQLKKFVWCILVLITNTKIGFQRKMRSKSKLRWRTPLQATGYVRA